MDMSDLDSDEDDQGAASAPDEQRPSGGATNLVPSGVDGQESSDSVGSEPSTSSSAEATTSTNTSHIPEQELDAKTDSNNDNSENAHVTDSNTDEISSNSVISQIKEPNDSNSSEDPVLDLKDAEKDKTVSETNGEDTSMQSETNVDKQASEERVFCLDEMESIEEVMSFGMDVLKSELMSRGLKCGGTLHQRALRLFSVKGLVMEEIDRALFAKSVGKNGKK